MQNPDHLPAVPPGNPRGSLAIRHPGMLQTNLLQTTPAATDGPSDDEIDLRSIFRTFLKHKWMLLGITAFCVAVAAVHTLRQTPLYQAALTLQIDRSTQRVVGFGTETEADGGYDYDNQLLTTQIETLKSRSLAERVIDELGLYKPSPLAPQSGQLPLEPAGDTAAAEADDTEAAELSLLQRLQANLKQLFSPSTQDEQVLSRSATVGAFQESVAIEPVRNSRLVRVKVTNADAELAARIANTMGKSYIAMSLERRADSSVYARQFLEDQIQQTKAKLEESERIINDYAKRNEILNLGDRGSAATQNYAEFMVALARAEQERIKAESIYNEVRTNPESAQRVIDNLAIQKYKEEMARLEAEYAKNLAVYKPEFPAMMQLRQQIDRLDAGVKAEVATVMASIKGQYDAAVRQEDLLRARAETSRNEVLTVQDRSVDMNLLQRELDTNRQIYDSLLQRLKQISVTAGITTNNVSIVDEASIPLFPSHPRPTINLALGLLVGLFAGMLAALLREHLDDSVKHADEIESVLGLPLLGWIPFTKEPKAAALPSVALLTHTDPRCAFSEAYRSMRTALQFSTTEGAPRRFVVTSCGKGEGKTTTALALAINFAQLGQQVLLIDADMRKSALHKTMGLSNARGLSNLLTGDSGTESLIQTTTIPNLCVLTAGPTPPDPVELLMGPKLGLLLDKAEELGFTQVIIDGPPLLGIADAIVLGNQVQHLVFVVKAASTKKQSVKDSLRRLRNAGVAPMGVALTHARLEHTGDYAYESYYGYGDAHIAPVQPAAQQVTPTLRPGTDSPSATA